MAASYFAVEYTASLSFMPSCVENRQELKQSLVGKAEVAVPADDDVIEEANPDDLSGLDEPGRDRTIFRTRGETAGGMIVHADDARGTRHDGGAEDFAGMDGRAVDGADADDVQGGDLEPSVQVQRDEGLLIHLNQVAQQPSDNLGGIELDPGQRLDFDRKRRVVPNDQLGFLEAVFPHVRLVVGSVGSLDLHVFVLQ